MIRHIDAGTDINAKNFDGYTALDYAIEGSHTEVAEYLRAVK